MDLGLLRLWNRLNSWWARQRGPDDDVFLNNLYQEALGRPPDPESRSRARESLQQGRLSRAAIRTLLLESPEHQAYQVTRQLYQEMLGSAPSPDERWTAVQLLQQNNLDAETLRRAIRSTIKYELHQAPVPSSEEPYRATTPPREVWLELTTRCNMVPPCIQCGRSAVKEDEACWHDMPAEIWQNLLPVLQQARTIGLHGGGEPLLYPHLFDLLGRLDPRRTTIGFNTNGHLLTEDRCVKLIEHGVAWLSVSLDAATPEMYLRLRRSEHLDRVLGNIRRLNEIKARLGSERPRLEVNMTVMGANLPEMPRFVELASGLGAARVMFQQIKPGGHWALQAPDGYRFDYEGEELTHHLPEHAEFAAQAWKRAGELGIPLEYEIAYPETAVAFPAGQKPAPAICATGEAPEETPPYPAGVLCGDPWTKILVSVDGDVTFCCYHNNLVILGNLKKQPFEEVWNGLTARTVRQLLLTKRTPLCCQSCFRTPTS